jgi:conjugal transfer pilus assembly protein TraD
MSRSWRSPYWLLLAFAVFIAAPSWATTGLAGAAVGIIGLRSARFLAARRIAGTSPKDAIAIGTDGSGREVSLSERELSAHGLILGASGAGKTNALRTILTQQIRRGRPVVVIDMKGSPEFARQLAEAAASARRPFKVWTPDGPNQWNPLQYGNATELKDKLICTERFTEPHYQRAAERYVQAVLQVLEASHPDTAPTLEEVVNLLDPRRLPTALRGVPRPLANRVQDYLAGLTPDQLSAVRGLQTRLAIVTESHTGRYLAADVHRLGPERVAGANTVGEVAGRSPTREVAGANTVGEVAGANPNVRSSLVDLRAALEGPEVVLFSLNSSKYGQLAAQLGTLAVQDLICGTGNRLEDRRAGRQQEQATIAIDEFSGIGGDHAIALFARCREAGVSVLVATQEMADLDRAGRGLRDQVLGNTAVKLILRQDVPASAQMIAQIAGTERTIEETREIGGTLFSGYPGRGTRREAEQFVIHPNEIKSLGIGDAVLISKLRGGKARTIQIHPPQRDSAQPAQRGAAQPAPRALARPQPSPAQPSQRGAAGSPQRRAAGSPQRGASRTPRSDGELERG